MLRAVFLLCAVLALAQGQTTEVSQCTAHGGELPINAYIDGCVVPPCQLPQLQDTIINIIFRAPHMMRNPRTLATAYLPTPIGNIPVPYDLQENAVTCNFMTNTYCPVVEGEVIQYTLRMYIESFFTVGIQASVEFRIVDDRNTPFMCIRVPIRIIAAIDNRMGAQNATITENV